MICIYKIKCDSCGNIFECSVDMETDKSEHLANCPECGNDIKISLAKTKQLRSLPESKIKSIDKKPLVDASAEQVITFKCIQRLPPHEQQSKIIKPAESRRGEAGIEIGADTGEPPEKSEPVDREEQIGLGVARSEQLDETDAYSSEKAFYVPPDPRPYRDSKEEPIPWPSRGSKRPIDVSHQKLLITGDARKRTERSPKPYLGKKRKSAGHYPYYAADLEKRPKRPLFLSKPESRLKLATVLLLLVFIFGLSHGISSLVIGAPESIGPHQRTQSTVDIDGNVRDFYTGRPIAGCVVKLVGTGQEDLTNSDGHYLITDVSVGDHELRAEAAGYSKIIKRVTVASEQPGNYDFELKPGVNTEIIDETLKTTEKQDQSINFFAVILIVFACFAIPAIFLIYQRNLFFICGFCAFISILSFGMGVGLVLGVIALILILLSGTVFKKRVGVVVKHEQPIPRKVHKTKGRKRRTN
jgi:hypothetical protein